MDSYSFVSTFVLGASKDDVWQVVNNFLEWKTWWSAVKDLSIEKEKIHPIIHLTLGYLFYNLHLRLSLDKIKQKELISITTTGDLVGNGTFLFEEKEKNVTKLIYIWNVKTTKTWMNIVAPVAHPFFEASHNAVMKEFIRGLARELNAIIIEEKYA